MTVETELREFAAKAEAYLYEEARAGEGTTREKFSMMRSIVLWNAGSTMARTPEALKLKASMLHDSDYFDREPTSGVANLIRSLLRDIREWDGQQVP